MTWVHRDTVSLATYVDASLSSVAKGRTWTGSPADVAALRGVQLARAVVMAQLNGSLRVGDSAVDGDAQLPTLTVNPSVQGNDERVRAARTLLGTAAILSRGRGFTGDLVTASHGGQDVSALPVLAVGAVVVVALAEVAAVGYVALESLAVINDDLIRNDESKRLAQKDAQALAIVKNHTDREAAAGKTLPLDEASRVALGDAAALQRQIAEKEGRAFEGVGSNGSNPFGFDWKTVLAVVAGAYVLGKLT